MTDDEIEQYTEAIQTMFLSESEEVKKALTDSVVPPALDSIVKKHKIPLDQVHTFENYIYLILIDEVSIESIKKWLISHARIPDEKQKTYY